MQAHEDLDGSDDESARGCELVVNNVPEIVFQNCYAKEEFTSLFCGYGSHATFRFEEQLGRAYVHYLSSSPGLSAQNALDGVEFEGNKLAVRLLKKLFSEYFLKPPPKKKEFLISPPISPPAAEPSFNNDSGVGSLLLQAAIAGLGKSGSVFELHPGDEAVQQPKIIVTLE